MEAEPSNETSTGQTWVDAQKFLIAHFKGAYVAFFFVCGVGRKAGGDAGGVVHKE